MPMVGLPERIWPIKNNLHSLREMGRTWHVERYLFAAPAGAEGGPDQLMIDSTSIKVHRSAGGEKGARTSAIGRSTGGRTRCR